MDEQQIAPLLGQGGIAAALIWIIYKVGTAMVAAIKELRTEISEHTKKDLEHHAEVKETVVRVESMVATMAEFTPVNQTIPRRPKTPAHGVSSGYYPPSRPKTQGGG